MLNTGVALNDVSHAIQLALAPAFLLTGTAGILNVMTGRLARIIDRGRRVIHPPERNVFASDEALAAELRSLEQRRRLASAAITAGTLSALLVCTVIAALFLEALLDLQLRWLVGLLFMGSTLALVVGLAYFLREVHLSTSAVRIGTVQPRI